MTREQELKEEIEKIEKAYYEWKSLDFQSVEDFIIIETADGERYSVLKAELKGITETKKEIINDLKEYRNIHSIGITALIGKKPDEQLQEYTDKVIDSVYDFLIKHLEGEKENNGTNIK